MSAKEKLLEECISCMTCGMKYLNNPYGIQVRHILDLMTDTPEEMTDAKQRSDNLFANEEGRKRKEALYQEPILNHMEKE